MRNNEDVDYVDSIVTFLDILGFKNLVRGSDQRPAVKIASELRKLGAYSTVHFGISSVAAEEPTCFHAFSDCVVRVRRWQPGAFCPALLGELQALAERQQEMAAYNVFLRGAVSIGKVYCDDRVVFGPAMIRAYELEKEALNPMIMLDPELFRPDCAVALEEQDSPEIRTEYKWRQLVQSDAEKQRLFVDYLTAHVDDHEWHHVKHRLGKHKSAVRKAARATSGRVWEKYSWVQRYHNATLARFKGQLTDADLAELWITDEDIRSTEVRD